MTKCDICDGEIYLGFTTLEEHIIVKHKFPNLLRQCIDLYQLIPVTDDTDLIVQRVRYIKEALELAINDAEDYVEESDWR